MQRILGLLGFMLAISISGFLFEWQNVWPFNADRVQLLRLVFYGFSIAALVALAVGRHWWLPPVLLAFGFVGAAALSNAQFDVRTVSLIFAFILGAAICSALVRPPLMRQAA
jgi:hypothetical protein